MVQKIKNKDGDIIAHNAIIDKQTSFNALNDNGKIYMSHQRFNFNERKLPKTLW